MTYRGSMPPGQAFPGQPEHMYAAPGAGQGAGYQHFQYPSQQQPQPQPRLHAQQPMQYANGMGAQVPQQQQQQQFYQANHHQHQQQQAPQQLPPPSTYLPNPQHQGYGYSVPGGGGGGGGMNQLDAMGYGTQQQQHQQMQYHAHQQQPQQQQQQQRYQQPAAQQYMPPANVWQQPSPQPQPRNSPQIFHNPLQAAQSPQHPVPSPQPRPRSRPQPSPQLQQQPPLARAPSQQHPRPSPTVSTPTLPQQQVRAKPTPTPPPPPQQTQQQHFQHHQQQYQQTQPSPALSTVNPQDIHTPPSISHSQLPQQPYLQQKPRRSPALHSEAQFRQQASQPQLASAPTPPQQGTPHGQAQSLHQPTQPQRQHHSPPPPLPPPPQPEPEPQQPEPVMFVNPQDIQQLPPPPPLKMPSSFDMVDATMSINPAMTLKEPVSIKREGSEPFKVPKIKDESHTRISGIKTSPHSSVSNSPALSARSPSISKRSPAVTPKQKPTNSAHILTAVAEECLGKAHDAVHDVAISQQPEQLEDYRKLIVTGLTCLEAAFQQNKLSPREEARLRLRYAAIVQEETEDLMQAETVLSKGISLCDQHRLFDLKYSMQYLMLKTLFVRNRKAALTAVDKHISDCEAFKYVHWYYAFRFLKASFYLETGTASDTSAFENIRAIHTLASRRGDKALCVFSSLLEGLSLLRSGKNDNTEKIRDCIAQVAKFQLDPTVKIVQIEVLTSLLDIASTIYREAPDITTQKLRQLQRRLDECDEWHSVKGEFLIPVRKQASAAKTLSSDTAAIARPGDADSDYDYLVMSFMTKMEFNSIIFLLSGMVNMHTKQSQVGRKSNELWQEGLKIFDIWDSSTGGIPYGPSVSLKTALRQRTWRTEAQAYLNILVGLMAASQCQWATVKRIVTQLQDVIVQSSPSALRCLSLFLNGVYYQGIGETSTALQIFLDRSLGVIHGGNGVRGGQRELALLATMNRVLIMQHPSHRDDEQTLDLLDQLRPLCFNHPNIDLRTVWHNVMAAVVTEPPQLLNEQKQHMHDAMAGVRTTNNVLEAAMTLCTMRSRFFENVVGEQALKSAMAAAKQAQKSGNLLWMSVADGMLAHSYEVQGHRAEATQEWEKATKEAQDAFAGS